MEPQSINDKGREQCSTHPRHTSGPSVQPQRSEYWCQLGPCRCPVECEDMVSVDVDRTLQVTIKRCCFFVVNLLVNSSSLPHLRSVDRRRPADCMQSSVHLTCMYTRIKSSLVPNLATDCSLIMLTEAALECMLTSAGRMDRASRGA